jgi:Cu(I)/Ag(I) efflux system membrane protein CusA/SilA
MINRVIAWSIQNRFLVLLATGAIVGAGLWALSTTPLDAIPDLSDVQVIVQTDFREQAPQIVEDQVTYPITSLRRCSRYRERAWCGVTPSLASASST